MTKELKDIIVSGIVRNKEQALIFAENAEFETFELGWGDFRIELDNGAGYVEIYGIEELQGDELIAVPDPTNNYEQEIRFYDKDMCEVLYIEIA